VYLSALDERAQHRAVHCFKTVDSKRFKLLTALTKNALLWLTKQLVTLARNVQQELRAISLCPFKFTYTRTLYENFLAILFSVGFIAAV
jgi:hypothetical protein